MNLKKIGEVFTSKFVGTGPSSYKKRIYRAAVSQRLRNTAVDNSAAALHLHQRPLPTIQSNQTTLLFKVRQQKSLTC